MVSTRVNFLLIGPGKSGTTAMHALLSRHRQVTMASVKETCFFNDHYTRGVAWYHDLFPAATWRQAVGEVSNTYLFSPDAAIRSAAYNPRMRVMSCLRNPVDRTFSHWLFLLRNAEIRGTFEDALCRRPDLVDRGMYARHLSHWISALGRDQILVLLFDRFVTDRLTTYNQLLTFIDVEPVEEAELGDGEQLAAAKPRNRLLARAVKELASWVRHAGHPRIIQAVKNSPLPRLLYRPYAKAERPTMRPETRAMLAGRFREDAERVSELVGEDVLAIWGLR